VITLIWRPATAARKWRGVADDNRRMAKTPALVIPSTANLASRDLSDAEFAELDELLAATPEPLEPLDVVMLDGYLCGVLVQPVLLEPAQWLPPVFDIDSRALPEGHDPVWQARCAELILRRHAALNRAMVEDGWFDPLVLEDGDEPEGDGTGTPADGEPASAAVAVSEVVPEVDEHMASLDPISRALMPWVAGFQHATLCFPALMELDNDDVSLAIARLFRHLPADTDEEREVAATLDREFPLATLDDAIEEMVVSVADLSDLTREARYHVETVQRDGPKLGRNDPCHCGSGKKYKACHGK
jgi:uncharacterized protein